MVIKSTAVFYAMATPSVNINLNEQKIAANEERLRALVTATADVIYSLNADWSVMRELDGRGFLRDANEPVADWRSRNVYPADLETVNAAISKAIKEKNIFQLEHRVLRADGTPGWTFSRAVPILDDSGEIIEWFGAASDITERKQAEEELAKTRIQLEQQKRLYETITSNTPDLMYVFGLDYRFTYANDALLTMWGKTWDNAVGKLLIENGYEQWHAEMHEREIDHIIATKETVRGEVSFPHAVLGRRVYDYILTPVINAQGEVEAVAGTTRDITDISQWQEKLEKSSQELQSMNEEIAASNEELAATNEELSSTNEELLQTQGALKLQTDEKQAAIDQLRANDQNVRNMVRQAPVGMCIVEGDPLYMIEINDIFLEIIGKTREQATTKPYWEVLPEAEAFYRPITERVLATGQTYHANEHEIMLVRNGVPETVHIDFVYEPMIDFRGIPYAIMIVAIDNTDKVLARRKVERAEESLRMAIDAADSGTYSINARTLDFFASPRLKELFGFRRDEDMPYEACMEQIHEDYRPTAYRMVEDALTKGIRFELEYPVIGFHDGKQRWLRGVGTLQHDSSSGDNFFTGIIIDITQQKEDEQRKNDFINMVSHELKTPLTSAISYVQVAERKALTNEDTTSAGMLDRAGKQLRKMTGMINGFLNVSRLESAKIHMDRHLFDMAELVKESEEETSISVNSHRVIFKPVEKTMVNADREKIGQVINNFISNAVKYSPADTTIQVACITIGDKVQVSVSDEGIGVSKDDLPKLFERYYRVKGNETRNIAGFGIGLYICSEIIKGHNGYIWAESTFGKGSTFYFTYRWRFKINPVVIPVYRLPA